MKNRVVVITGAFGALGRSVAERALEAGARVALVDISERLPTQFEGLPADKVLALGGSDLSESGRAAQVFQRVFDHFGAIDVLLNVAGGFRWETVADGDVVTWDFLYQTNLRTAVAACQAALPFLRQSHAGAIVNVGANAAAKAGLGMAAYAASKAGIAKLTESLAEELKGQVTVNAVLPSIIDTPVNRADMPDADFAKWVAPSALARAMLFLASRDSRAITGALLPVVGGL